VCFGFATAFGFGAGLTAGFDFTTVTFFAGAVFLATTVFLTVAFLGAVVACFATGWRGLITGAAVGEELLPPPSSRKPPPRASTATPTTAARTGRRASRLTRFLSAAGRRRLTGKTKGAVSRALRRFDLGCCLAAAGLDVARRAGLVVLDGARRRVDDAVGRR